MRFSPEKIEEVRQASDIVEVIGASVRLRKRGKNYIGLCPFHGEKTPSFNVSPDRGMYHCFGCGVGGNVITFVMEHDKLTFPEAVRMLAERAGISLPQESGPSPDDENEGLYEVCREAARFFYRALTESEEGKIALAYVRSRGFSDETIRTFGLGYAPHSWDALTSYAAGKGIPRALVEKAGLVRRRDDGSMYDYFRGRAIFPIFTPTGRVCGFGARKLREDDPLGKYINSPETPLYNKSRILYGLYQAKEEIRSADGVYLVEGYADLITLHQSGTKNVVASSGTALTPEQIALIGRYTKNITIVYDADSAGSKAALRGVDLLLARDFDVKVVPLPHGEDPDSFVRKEGGEAFRKVDAVSFVDFIALAYEREGKLKTPEGEAQTVRALVKAIALMPDELKRNFYIRHVAGKYRLYESTLQRELERVLKGSSRTPAPAPDAGQAPPAVRKAGSPIPPLEKDLLRTLLDGGADIVRLAFAQIAPEEFTHPDARALASALYRAAEEGAPIDPATFGETEEQRRLVAGIVFSRFGVSRSWKDWEAGKPDPEVLVADAVAVFKKRTIEELLHENQRLMKAAIARGEDSMPFLERDKQLRAEFTALDGGK